MTPLDMLGALAAEQWEALARQAEREGVSGEVFILDVLAREANRILHAEALDRYDEPSTPYRPRLLGL